MIGWQVTLLREKALYTIDMVDGGFGVKRRRTMFRDRFIVLLLQKLPSAEVGRGPAFVGDSEW